MCVGLFFATLCDSPLHSTVLLQMNKQARVGLAIAGISAMCAAVNYGIYCRVGSRLAPSKQTLLRQAKAVVWCIDDCLLEGTTLQALAQVSERANSDTLARSSGDRTLTL